MTNSASDSLPSSASQASSFRSSAAAHDVEEQEILLRERYRSWADSYDGAFASYSEQSLSEAMRALGTPLPRQVLDLACGTGLLIDRLLRHDPDVEVTGVDISDEMLARARHRLSRAAHVRLLSGRAECIPASSRAFDAVVIANAFHLIQDPDAALDECRRVLRPGGTLVVVDWCRDALPMRAFAWALALTQRLRRRIVTAEVQRRMLTDAGFEVRTIHRFRAQPLWDLMSVQARLA